MKSEEKDAPELDEGSPLSSLPPMILEPPLRTYGIYGEINEEQGRNVTLALHLLRDTGFIEGIEDDKDAEGSYDPIDLIISTEGGNVQDMFSIYDCMRAIKLDCDIQTFGVGKVMSAGILLLAGGTKGQRKIGKHCRLMMHSVQGGHFGSLKELETDIREVRWYQEQFIKALVEETKLSYKELKTIFRKKTDTYFDATQAVKWGIADEIV